MKKNKIISLLLSLALILTSLLQGNRIYAEGSSEGSKSGMEISKTAVDNEDGTYTITLEAYATGSKVITQVQEEVPTDIVLVLDQSGSMEDGMGSVTFDAYRSNESSNEDHYDRRHNGGSNNLWHKVGDNYYSVSVERVEKLSYEEIQSYRNNSSDMMGYYTNLWNKKEYLYAKVGGAYQKVTVTRTGFSGTYTYLLPDGTVIATSEEYDGTPVFANVDEGKIYLATSDYDYTYTYSDADDVLQTIGTSSGAETVFTTTLYERVVDTNGGTKRIVALQDALRTFTAAVNEKAAGADGELSTTDDNINHRIAVVGFASKSGYGNNTEVFIGSSQHQYGNAAQGVYGAAFQSMDTQQGQNNVAASINALATEGATQADLGMEMAEGILDANPVAADTKRNRVVIMFTDGSPTTFDGFETNVANNAINISNRIKADGVTVYAVGVFSGADATSAGSSNGNDTAKCNWFMQNVSSNNGVVQNPSYYLSAGDAETLNNIFQQISDNIESGGSSTTLGEETVIKDIIAPQFKLPEGATAGNITLKTYSCTGKSGNDYTWEENPDTMGASASVNGDKVDVTGFDFAENYVGTITENGAVTYRGHKLVISFNIVVKDGFLGGNDVFTNTSAGVYENSKATEPVLTFERPQVDVAIKPVTVTAEDKNVYLLADLTAAEIKAGITAKCGDVILNLSAENYGLETWQNEYVDISVAYADKDNQTITDLNDMVEDNTYSAYVTITPRFEGTATAQSGNDTGNINVFKPVLTYQDSTVYYGAAAPEGYTENEVGTIWKHGETVNTAVTMIGIAPELNKTYALIQDTDIKDGLIHSKKDIPVKVTSVNVKDTSVIDHVTFIHTDCQGTTKEDLKDGTFLLHVKTCSLIITKTGGASDEPYVFDIYKDGKKYTEASIVGNQSVTIYELPIGKYTAQEDEGWSWRYSADNGEAAVLSASAPDGSITCANTQNKEYWLNGFSKVVTNILGLSQEGTNH